MICPNKINLILVLQLCYWLLTTDVCICVCIYVIQEAKYELV